jgi:hypothetical protein
MIMFGGIFEITKELNDCHFFDFKSRKWITLFEECGSPKRSPHEVSMLEEDSSPLDRHNSRKQNTSLTKSPQFRKGSPPKA